jgi:hypothetical protein
MKIRWDGFLVGLASVAALAGVFAIGVHAQTQSSTQTPPGLPTEITQNRFNAGQSVIPYYEGWIKNPDGTFDLMFGYFNRNYQEEFSIPPGPENKVEPGAVDQGQPTYFLTRRQRFLYRVRVPANFGKGIVTWSITTHGRTEKAFGDLIAPEEITERVVMTNGNFDPGLDDPNKPPVLKLAPIQNVTVGVPVSLNASIADDGLPKPRAAPPAPPQTTTPTGGITAQVNSSGGGRPRGLTMSWMEYGGPAKVTFSSAGPVQITNGEAKMTARFAAPGTYKLIANASDGAMSTKIPVTVVVTGQGTK